MLRTLSFSACLAVLATASMAASSVKLGPSPTLGGGDYNIGGGITVAVEPRRATDGTLAICGVWAQSEVLVAYVRRSGEKVLSKGSIRVGDTTVHRDLRFLSRVKPAKSYAGADAACVKTDMPWRENTRLIVHIPRQTIERDAQPGIEVTFNRSDSKNPALKKGSFLPKRFYDLFSG